VLSARAMGAGTAAMTLRHILPNTAPVLFAYVGSNAGQAIIAYAALAFIGLGADPTRPDWGGMLFEYRMFVFDSNRCSCSGQAWRSRSRPGCSTGSSIPKPCRPRHDAACVGVIL
jgi:hypothetical protein